jgi:hypothetical protein
MKFEEPHPFANPDAAARKVVEIANGVEAVQDGPIYMSASTSRLARRRQRRPVPRRDRTRHCTRLDMAARERHLCEVHRQRRGAVCLRSVTCSHSKVPSIVLQAPSASSNVLNGEPITLTAPVLEYSGRHEARKP